jgi:hypothetical protein
MTTTKFADHISTGSADQSIRGLVDNVRELIKLLPHDQRDKFVTAVSDVISETKKSPAMSAASEPVRGKFTAMQAAAAGPNNLPLVKFIRAEASRMGYEIPVDKPVDVAELNKALAGQSPERRMDLKARLHFVGMID